MTCCHHPKPAEAPSPVSLSSAVGCFFVIFFPFHFHNPSLFSVYLPSYIHSVEFHVCILNLLPCSCSLYPLLEALFSSTFRVTSIHPSFLHLRWSLTSANLPVLVPPAHPLALCKCSTNPLFYFLRGSETLNIYVSLLSCKEVFRY